MKRTFFLLLACALATATAAQTVGSSTTPEQEAYWKKWAENLYEAGIDVRQDSLVISEEARRVALDTVYRKIVYRETYTWELAMQLMEKMQLKIGFWHLLNLYAASPADRDRILKYILSFDSLMDMDRVMIGTFYTYGLLDAATGRIESGRLQVTRPDLVEKKLGTVKEISNTILAYRAYRAGKE
jgi:hypothetical protein